MNYKIIKNINKVGFLDENKHMVYLDGFAFMDIYDNCSIIVYGDGKKDLMIKYLNNTYS